MVVGWPLLSSGVIVFIVGRLIDTERHGRVKPRGGLRFISSVTASLFWDGVSKALEHLGVYSLVSQCFLLMPNVSTVGQLVTCESANNSSFFKPARGLTTQHPEKFSLATDILYMRSLASRNTYGQGIIHNLFLPTYLVGKLAYLCIFERPLASNTEQRHLEHLQASV